MGKLLRRQGILYSLVFHLLLGGCYQSLLHLLSLPSFGFLISLRAFLSLATSRNLALLLRMREVIRKLSMDLPPVRRLNAITPTHVDTTRNMRSQVSPPDAWDRNTEWAFGATMHMLNFSPSSLPFGMGSFDIEGTRNP